MDMMIAVYVPMKPFRAKTAVIHSIYRAPSYSDNFTVLDSNVHTTAIAIRSP